MAMNARVNPVFPFRRPPELDGAAVRVARWSSWARVRSASPRRSTSRSAACECWCSTTTAPSASARARSATPSARWRSSTGSAAARRSCDRGVQWNVGRVFFRDALAYRFDLLPEPGHRRPAFVNLQQYHFEECLVEQRSALRRRAALAQRGGRRDAARTTASRSRSRRPRDATRSHADWLIAADGARSPVRRHARPRDRRARCSATAS